MWATRVTMCVAWLPFVKRLTEHMCWYCESESVCACLCAPPCTCVYMKGSNCVSWGPPGSAVQILGPEQLAWGLVRVFSGGGGRFERGVGGRGGSSIAPVPPDPDSRRQMDRPPLLPEGQRGHRAKGKGQPRPTELTQRKKTHTQNIVADEIHVKYKNL